MKRIAIRGNKERSEEIIKYFKNLGANNINNQKCNHDNLIYFVNDNNEIDCKSLVDDTFEVFNIEEIVKENKNQKIVLPKIE